MKTINNIKFLSVLFILGLMVSSCVQDDDFDIPEINFEEPDVDVNTTIAGVKAFYQGFEPVLIHSGDPANSNPMYFEGYVVSSDESGNFYKTIVIQDKPENPTAGISISTETTDMYTFYEPGRKIYFRVDGLYSGVYAELPTLGTLQGEEVGRMSIDEFESRIFRSNTVEEIVPNVKTIGSVTDADLNTLVAFENVQVSDADLGEPYANLENTFSVNRTITNCEQSESIILRNSGFANFKNETMPQGNGTLTAIFSVFNSDYQLFIRDTDDVNFDQERCGFEYEEIIVDFPFFEDFDEQTAGVGAILSMEGWSNINVNGGQGRYEVREFSGNQYAQTSAYNTDEDPYEVWLVTPGVNLSGASNPVLTFDSKDGYYNGQALQVFVSTNYEGDPTQATWTAVDATISTGNEGGYGDNFVASGQIDLSSYANQNVFVGFKYEGGANGVTTTYQIDNVSIDEGDSDPDPAFPFFEDFEGIANTGPGELIALPGWTNQNVSGGNRRYEAREFDGNKYAQITAFNSEEATVEAWLVTPGVDLSGATAPALSFLTKDGFNNGEGLKVYVSTDFSGDASAATWTELSATIATGTTDGYAENFTASGTISLSAYNGQTVYIGFEYVGGNGGTTTTYQIDDVNIFNE